MRLREKDELLYDSGEVACALHQGIKIPFEGLKSFTAYTVQVSVRDLGGVESDCAAVDFVTGAMRAEDFHGEWIGTGGTKPFYARKQISAKGAISRAYAAVCGLGQFNFSINGKKVSHHELDPGWTNYDKKAQYVLFDVTEYLRQGDNTLGVSVGNGFYLADKGERYFFEMPPAAMKAFMPPQHQRLSAFRRGLDA